ncbi:radical SAM protein [Deltaproteobacteria bacterium]|nr:radical SAM protein [Deltaproteobacteria bacterium]
MENEQLILHSAMESNILPIISGCDAACVFCSHHNNPDGIRVVSIPPMTLKQVEWTMRFLNGRQKITIGESATNIIEGEPLCHPEFKEIISLVRQRFTTTQISITTNGHRLNEKTVEFLKKVEPVEINLSLNSATIEGRSILMGDKHRVAEQTRQGVKLLCQSQIEFHGSIVAMPHLVGWEDIEETVRYLADNGAITVRIFMPGYSKKANPKLHFDTASMQKELKAFVDDMAENMPCPVLLEPSYVSDLIPVVSGVISGSKAWEAGLRKGDIVIEVKGRTPRSRVEAWGFMQMPGKISAEIERNGEILNLGWDNAEGGRSGAILEYDFDMSRMEAISHFISSCQGKVLALSSEFAFNVLKAVFQIMQFPEPRFDVYMVKNRLFGGSIMASGLLSVADFSLAFEEYCSHHEPPDYILIPLESFDWQGYDITGRSHGELAKITGIETKVM